ncbi:hypothetical protein MBRA_03816 [Methylobacterium brachiatum]|nr:hypothetical protein MBRA_03816 [Methylobacterium brachiatum]
MADSRLDAFSAGAGGFFAMAYEMYGFVEHVAIDLTGILDRASREATAW